MVWKKAIYDSLTGCAALCDTFAKECSRSGNVASRHRSVFLSLDCADVCRQVVALYVRGSESTRIMAKECVAVCELCIEELSRTDYPDSRRVQVVCRQTIQTCVSLLNTIRQTDPVSPRSSAAPVSLYSSLSFRTSLYN